MRVVFSRPFLARTAALVASLICLSTLLGTATARDDLGLRLSQFWTDQRPVAQDVEPAEVPALPLLTSEGPRRPLRIKLLMPHRTHIARRRTRGSVLARAAVPRLQVLAVPTRPAIVSIYADRTLRNGDAVMLADGIHVFRGAGAGPFRPHDFVRLPLVASLGWRLRQTLNDLDRNPPMRWSSTRPDGVVI